MSKELVHRILARCYECGDCLIWPGAMADKTSPAIRMLGKTYTVRRVLWEDKHGPLREGATLGLACESLRCVRHIKPMTAAEQAQRRLERQPWLAGDVHSRRVSSGKREKSKWADADLAELRAASRPITEVAAALGMNHSYACAIARGQARKDLSSPFAGLGARP